MMKSVTEPGGTATIAAIRGYHVAGKTGTAQKFINGEYSHKKYTASFVGFVPAEKPRFVLLVTADEPHGSYYGGAVSGPYFKSIAERTLKYMHTPPDMDFAVYDAKFKAAKAKVMEEKRRLWAQEAKERAERARRRQMQKSQTKQLQARQQLDEVWKEIKSEKLGADKTEAKAGLVAKVGSFLGSSKLKELERRNQDLQDRMQKLEEEALRRKG